MFIVRIVNLDNVDRLSIREMAFRFRWIQAWAGVKVLHFHFAMYGKATFPFRVGHRRRWDTQASQGWSWSWSWRRRINLRRTRASIKCKACVRRWRSSETATTTYRSSCTREAKRENFGFITNLTCCWILVLLLSTKRSWCGSSTSIPRSFGKRCLFEVLLKIGRYSG